MQTLTRREKEVFDLLLDGNTPKDITGKLKISYETVVSHQKKIYRKLDVHSIEELLEKYKGEKEDNSSLPIWGRKRQRLFQPKILVPAGMAVIILIFVLFGIRYFTPPLSNIIYLEDGTFFTIHTFDEVHMYADRWGNKDDGAYGENYSSKFSLRLMDIYSGTLDDLFPNTSINNVYRFMLSGTVDKEFKNMRIALGYYIPGRSDGWITIAGTEHSKSVRIGPGDFTQVFSVKHSGLDTNSLPDGGVFVVHLLNDLFLEYHGFILDNGERIPDDVPNNAIWATIKNLRIEPMDRLR